MEINVELLDEWIKKAGLEEIVSVYGSAIEINTHLLHRLPKIEGVEVYEDGGYQILAKLLEAAKEVNDDTA